MPTLLKIDVSPRGDYSVSRQLGKTLEAEWLVNNPGGTIVNRDLSKNPIPFVDLPWIAAAYSPSDQHTTEQAAAIKLSDELIAELLAADEVLIDTPFYNFSIPAALKAWIDQVVRLDKTFTANYKGLAGGRKVTVVVAAGGNYGPGSHMEQMDFASPYLTAIFGFIGITDVRIHLLGDTTAIFRGTTTMEAYIADHTVSLTA